MFKTEIIDNELYLEGIAYSDWSPIEWTKWKSNTKELMTLAEKNMHNLMILYATGKIPYDYS